jgi:hypothetical protein
MRRSDSNAVIASVFLLSVAAACSANNETPTRGASTSGGLGEAGIGGSGIGGSSIGGSGGISAGGSGAVTAGGSGAVSAGGSGGTSAGGSGGIAAGGSGGISTGGSSGISTGGSGAVSTGGSGGTSTGGSSGTSTGGSSGAGTGGAGTGGGGAGGTSGTGGTAGDAGMPATGGDAGSAGTGETGGTGGTTEECVVPSGSPGTVITFNDDGGWCWYQDERAIVDPDTNTLIFSSVATGGSRNGNIEATMYSLDGGGSPQRSRLGDLNPDDHNVAGLLKLDTGRYVAMYTTHNDDCYSYYNIYENGSWGSQNRFDWGPHGCPTPTDRTVSYSNLWHVSGQIYNFVRSVETSPNLMVSTDGSSWSYGGRLTETQLVGYVAGYYKYWGNNVDRVDFVGTEAHPRDNDNSLYHGYVQNEQSHLSNGQVVDDNITDGTAPDIPEFTTVFATGSTLGNVTLRHLWNIDLMRYDDGSIVLLFQGRADGNTDDPDKRFGYARFDGSSWRSTYLVKAGHKLYDSEQDYTGLGAIHPNSPYTIYISTTTDPRDDTTSFAKHEIWRGTTCDEGATFTWTPITENSTEDNLRPIVPYWDSSRTVLLWMRGTYSSAQTYSTSIVGIVIDGR